MSETSVPTNGAVAASDLIVHGLVDIVLVNAAIVAATAALPVLGVWPLSMILRAVLNRIAAFVSVTTKTEVAHFIIDKQTEQEAADTVAAKIALNAAQEKGDKDAVAKAKAEFDKRMADLFRITA